MCESCLLWQLRKIFGKSLNRGDIYFIKTKPPKFPESESHTHFN